MTVAYGERAAAIYSLIGTAKLNGLDPEAYLRDLIRVDTSNPPGAETPAAADGTDASAPVDTSEGESESEPEA